jgi:hypothetical protein
MHFLIFCPDLYQCLPTGIGALWIEVPTVHNKPNLCIYLIYFNWSKDQNEKGVWGFLCPYTAYPPQESMFKILTICLRLSFFLKAKVLGTLSGIYCRVPDWYAEPYHSSPTSPVGSPDWWTDMTDMVLRTSYLIRSLRTYLIRSLRRGNRAYGIVYCTYVVHRN